MTKKVIANAFDKTFVNVKKLYFNTIARKTFCFDKESKKKHNLIQFMTDFERILIAVSFIF